MKILSFVDSHGSIPILKRVIKKAKYVDILICAGDISWFSDNLKELIKILSTSPVPVIITHGNHETAKNLRKVCKPYKNITFMHKRHKRIGNHLFFVYGGGGFAMKDKTFELIGKKFEKKIKPEDKVILITHAPPHDTRLDVINKQHLGNKSITKFIRRVQPVLAISGHFHETEYIEYKYRKTILINPGPKGMITEI